MKVRIALWIEKITSLFWIIPGIMALSFISLGFVLKDFDAAPAKGLLREIFFMKAEPEAVRLLLSSIATSIMTVIGVVFSIIILVIEQMSNQYTPRVISNYSRSKMAQIVLGLFAGTFGYSLVLLMNINGIESQKQIPGLAVALAGIMAFLCLFFLIIYIHSVTKSIQSTQIIKDITEESIESLRNVIKDREDAHNESMIRSKGFNHCHILHSSKVGYIDSISWEKLGDKLKFPDWEIHFHKTAGDYVQKEMEILSVWSDVPIDGETLSKLEDIIEVAPNRTISQDPGYGIQKLSDIALKALSPGINDPSTAMEAIHSITTILLEYLREFPIRNRVHLKGNKVLIFLPIDPHKLIQKGYDHILSFSEKHEVVKDLVRQDLRYIQRKVKEHDLKRHIEYMIHSIQLLQ